MIRSNNPDAGWGALLAHAKPSTRASLIKVPHHASDGAHQDAVWDEMLAANAVAIVTPWTLAGRYLPQEPDLDRLRKLTRRLFVTAVPALKRVDQDHAVKRLVQRLHGDRIEELRGWGHVRARRAMGTEHWDVVLDGDATLVEN